jgi:hypothetical protein
MRPSRDDRPSAVRDNTWREGADLNGKYGRIGISAVAAAARYCSGAKTSTATEAPRPPMRHEDEAAA